MPNPWFKFYGGEYLSDAKMDRYSAAERGVWLTILSLASVSNTPGIIVNTNEDRIRTRTGVMSSDAEWDILEGVLKKFEDDGMIVVSDATIKVTKWDARQAAYPSYAEKKAKYRKLMSDNERTPVLKMSPLDIEEEGHIEKDNTNTYTDDYDDALFKEFWEVYPNKKGKGAAWKAWSKLKGVKKLAPAIIESVKQHAANDKQWTKDDGQYIPHPSTFLNGRRWDDEVKAPITKKSDRF